MHEVRFLVVRPQTAFLPCWRPAPKPEPGVRIQLRGTELAKRRRSCTHFRQEALGLNRVFAHFSFRRNVRPDAKRRAVGAGTPEWRGEVPSIDRWQARSSRSNVAALSRALGVRSFSTAPVFVNWSKDFDSSQASSENRFIVFGACSAAGRLRLVERMNVDS